MIEIRMIDIPEKKIIFLMFIQIYKGYYIVVVDVILVVLMYAY